MTHSRSRWLGLVAWLLASSAAARAADLPPGDAADRAGLRLVRSAHYLIHTDIPDAGLVADLARRMDVMYGLYADQLSEFRPPADAPPLPVYLFARRDRYVTFTRAVGANTAGLFVAGRHPFLTSFLGGQGRDALRRALQHEAFHQFAYSTVSRHLPIWLNEGMAQVFEEGIWDGKSFLLGQVPPRRVRQLRADLDHNTAVPLAQFLTITPAVWSDVLHTDAARGETNYNQAWAVAQFLTQGPNADFRRRGADLLRRLHALDATAADDDGGPAVAALGDPAAAAAFAACFPDVPALQAAFDAWARPLRATASALLVDRQETLGDFLIDLQQVGHQFDTVAAFRSAVVGQRLQIRYARGAVRYRSYADPMVYFADLDGVVFPPDKLCFQPSPGAPLPDLVCQPIPTFRLRTHFYAGDRGRPEHEVAIEPVDPPSLPGR